MLAKFWQGAKNGEKKFHWMSWESVESILEYLLIIVFTWIDEILPSFYSL